MLFILPQFPLAQLENCADVKQLYTSTPGCCGGTSTGPITTGLHEVNGYFHFGNYEHIESYLKFRPTADHDWQQLFIFDSDESYYSHFEHTPEDPSPTRLRKKTGDSYLKFFSPGSTVADSEDFIRYRRAKHVTLKDGRSIENPLHVVLPRQEPFTVETESGQLIKLQGHMPEGEYEFYYSPDHWGESCGYHGEGLAFQNQSYVKFVGGQYALGTATITEKIVVSGSSHQLERHTNERYLNKDYVVQGSSEPYTARFKVPMNEPPTFVESLLYDGTGVEWVDDRFKRCMSEHGDDWFKLCLDNACGFSKAKVPIAGCAADFLENKFMSFKDTWFVKFDEEDPLNTGNQFRSAGMRSFTFDWIWKDPVTLIPLFTDKFDTNAKLSVATYNVNPDTGKCQEMDTRAQDCEATPALCEHVRCALKQTHPDVTWEGVASAQLLGNFSGYDQVQRVTTFVTRYQNGACVNTAPTPLPPPPPKLSRVGEYNPECDSPNYKIEGVCSTNAADSSKSDCTVHVTNDGTWATLIYGAPPKFRFGIVHSNVFGESNEVLSEYLLPAFVEGTSTSANTLPGLGFLPSPIAASAFSGVEEEYARQGIVYNIPKNSVPNTPGSTYSMSMTVPKGKYIAFDPPYFRYAVEDASSLNWLNMEGVLFECKDTSTGPADNYLFTG